MEIVKFWAVRTSKPLVAYAQCSLPCYR